MIVKIYKDSSYHLYASLQSSYAIPFTDMLKNCAGKYSKAYSLYRNFGDGWERVGSIRVRDLLLMTPDINPIFHSLRKLRGESYTWADFVEARKKRLKEKKN